MRCLITKAPHLLFSFCGPPCSSCHCWPFHRPSWSSWSAPAICPLALRLPFSAKNRRLHFTPLALHARYLAQNHQPVLIFATASPPQRLRPLSRLLTSQLPSPCLFRWPAHPFHLFAPPTSFGSIHHRQNGRPQPPSVSRPLRCSHYHSYECARTIAVKLADSN